MQLEGSPGGFGGWVSFFTWPITLGNNKVACITHHCKIWNIWKLTQNYLLSILYSKHSWLHMSQMIRVSITVSWQHQLFLPTTNLFSTLLNRQQPCWHKQHSTALTLSTVFLKNIGFRVKDEFIRNFIKQELAHTSSIAKLEINFYCQINVLG